MKRVKTVHQVLDILGGAAAVADLPCMRRAGVKRGAVQDWKVQEKLPARTFIAIRTQLERLGYLAPISLWGMIEP